MTISKRLRFEIFRRDGFRCTYCGARADETGDGLHVDHVIPQALGGDDDPTNLTTACKDCNLGKASVPADAPLVAAVDELLLRRRAAIRESLEMELAVEQILVDHAQDLIDKWDDYTLEYDGSLIPREDDATLLRSVVAWDAAGFPTDRLIDLVPIAMAAPGVAAANTWRYFCGIVWRRIRDGGAA